MTITKYRQLAADLREDIRTGRYPPGTPLPTYLEMAAERGVSKTTVSTALEILEAEGLVRPVRKRGTVDRKSTRLNSSHLGYTTLFRSPTWRWPPSAAYRKPP